MSESQAIIRLVFSGRISCRYDGPIIRQLGKTGPRCDALKIGVSSIKLVIKRKQRIRIEDALNNATFRELRTAALYVAAVSGVVPPLKRVEVSASDEMAIYSREDSGAAAPLFTWEYAKNKGYPKELLMPEEVAEVLFLQTHTAKAARVSTSFLLAAARADDETVRLRHLWSAFNHLYQLYGSLASESTIWQEAGFLRFMHERICSSELLLPRTLAHFSMLGADEVSKCVNWGYLAKDESDRQKRRKNPSDNPCYMTREAYEQCQEPQAQIAFLLTCYLYHRRCKSMHGNMRYPIFSFGREDLERSHPCDLLTLAIIDVMEKCAEMEHQLSLETD